MYSATILLSGLVVLLVLLLIHQRGLMEKQFRKELSRQIFLEASAAKRLMQSYSEKDPKKRLEILLSAAEIRPECHGVYNAIGYAYLDMGKTSEALAAFGRAVQYHPSDSASLADLAYGHLLSENRNLARRYFEEAVSLSAAIAEEPRFAELRD